MDIEKIERKLEEKKEYIKRVFHIREIGIFGSFIRGEQSASSDIDILVEFEKGHKDFFIVNCITGCKYPNRGESA